MAQKSRKFDRNRKSAQNSSYKLGNRKKVNSEKKQARNAKLKGKAMKVVRGTARAKRRVAKQQAYAATHSATV